MGYSCVCEECPCVSYAWEGLGVSVCLVEVSHVPACYQSAAETCSDVVVVLALDGLGCLRINSIRAYGQCEGESRIWDMWCMEGGWLFHSLPPLCEQGADFVRPEIGMCDAIAGYWVLAWFACPVIRELVGFDLE